MTSLRSGRLADKVAVITGGTSGIALATAKRFVAEGAFVFITGRDQDRLNKAIETLASKNVSGVQADSSKIADLKRVYEQVKLSQGHIDVLFVSAGYGELTVPLGSITEELVHKTFNVNVTGTIFSVQLALPLFRDGGSIILNGAIGSIKGFPAGSVYGASKAAVRSLSRTFAAELASRSIRVNTVSPGPIDTPVFDSLPAGFKPHMASLVPLKRMGTSDEVANTVLFLASSESSFITGIELFVDGGLAQF